MNLAYIHLVVAVIAMFLALPLIFRKVKMNGIYGIRIPEAFRSEERWYEINRFGGILFFLWGVGLGILGAAGLRLERSQWPKYNTISFAAIAGGLLVVVVAIFIYAAKTKKK